MKPTALIHGPAFALCAALASISAWQSVAAEPVLHMANQPGSGRLTPPPMVIDDYHGKLRWGYEMVQFIAPGGELRWDAWDDPAYIAVVREAIRLVEQRAVNNYACNRYFAERMPGGKTLAEVWHASGAERVRISFSPGPSGLWRAATYPYKAPFEWTITETTVSFGPESVASALVHEATRANGVGRTFRIANGAGKACGMQHFALTKPVIKQLGWPIKAIQTLRASR